MLKSSFRAMGTDVEVCIGSNESVGDEDLAFAYEQAAATIKRMEAKFTRFDADSELSYVNANAGVWLDVSSEMATVLRLAKEAYEVTGGLFDPCLGKVMQTIGYRETFDKIGTQSTFEASSLSNGILPTNAKHADVEVVLHPLLGNELRYLIPTQFNKVYLFPNYQIDLGGIAKGWIVQQAAHVIKRQGLPDFLVSAGGDMVCSGRNGDRPWQVGVTNPWDLDESVLTLNVESACVATSGTYRRHWGQGPEHMHHLIHPSFEKPAVTDVVSCTVVASTLSAAEVYAKTCLLLGAVKGPEWLKSKKQLGWVIIRADGEMIHSWNE